MGVPRNSQHSETAVAVRPRGRPHEDPSALSAVVLAQEPVAGSDRGSVGEVVADSSAIELSG
jgi:hypothetical protein